MSYRKPQPRSPPRSYKVNFLEQPPLENSQKTLLVNLVSKIVRQCANAEQIQIELSNQLCRSFKKSVGVSVLENRQGYPQYFQLKQYPGTVVISFTMNEYAFRIWIHESKDLEEDPFRERRQQTK